MPKPGWQVPPFRAEIVGSLLRPRALKEAHAALAEGRLDAAGHRAVLEREIARAVRMQEEAGLPVVSDGEFQRASWFGFFFAALDGFALKPSLYRFRDAEGGRHEWPTAYASAPIRRTRGICMDEFATLRRFARAVPKATMPAPSALHFFRGGDAADPAVYPDPERYWDDVVAVYRAEVAELGRLGCTYLQFDEVPIAMLCDSEVAAEARRHGGDPDRLLERYLGVLNRILAGRPAGMTVGLHLCRGNFRSRWMAAGGYEPVARRLFAEAAVDVFLLEYDSERAGDFAPLRHLPGEKAAILGLVSTKTPELEAEDALLRRLDEAARFAPAERLGLSPQCGFASVAGGNLLDEDMQRRKLELVAAVARRAWGG